MKTLKELRTFTLPTQKVGFHLKSLIRKQIDFDVFLHTKGCNLQREFVWTIEQKRELVWSILLERNIPNLALIERIDESLQVIDGKQRLSASFDFVNNLFPLIIEGNEYLFKDLPHEYRIAIEMHYFPCIVAYENSKLIEDEQKIHWFKRINFAGTPQDVEHFKSLI